MSTRQFKAEMGATVCQTKAEFQRTISEGSRPEPCTGSCTGADRAAAHGNSITHSCHPPVLVLPLPPCIPPSPSGLQHPGGPCAPPRCSLRAGALHSDRNEFAFPSPCSPIWTIRHALALISSVLGFLEPFCGIAGEGFSFSSPVSCSVNKPGCRKIPRAGF